MTTTANPAGRLSRTEFIAMMAALMAMNALAIDILLPALPNLGAAYHVANANQRQLVIGAYMLGFGLAQICFGPLSDRFGRRNPLLIGIGIYVVVALSAVLAPSFEVLLTLRLLQGLGAAATRVIAVSIVRDCFVGRAMAEVMSLAFMVFMVVPIIAPGLGQIILLTGPWQYVFVFMAFVGAMVGLWAFLRLPETLAINLRRPLTLAAVLRGFALVFTNRSALAYGVAGVFLFAALFGFIASAQQIYVDIYGLGPLFPLAFAAMAGLMSVSSFLNSRLVMHWGMRRMSHFGIVMHVVFSGVLLIASLMGYMPLWLFFGLVAVIMFMFSWSSANMNSLSMEPLGAVAGTASSVFGFMQTVGGALLGTYTGQHFDGTVTPVAAGYFAYGVAALVCCLVAEKGRLFGVGAVHP